MKMSSARTALLGWFFAFAIAQAVAQELVLRCDPSQTLAHWSLDATLHTVRGDFKLKRGEIHFDPSSGKVSGEIVFDATSGQSGNPSRDSKMHRVVLESQRYREICFRPDHAAGELSTAGGSGVQVHGVFVIHGSEHEITVPVDVRLEAGHWSATALFRVPYVKWGLKDPSTFLLHVSDSVNIDLHAEGERSPSP